MSEYHPLKGTMTAAELMAYLDISVDTLRKLRADGLPTFKSGRVVLFSRQAVDEWIYRKASQSSQPVQRSKKSTSLAPVDI